MRTGTTLALTLLLPTLLPLLACQAGSSDDSADPDTGAGTTEAPASDGLSGPDPETSTAPGTTTEPEPTTADPSEGGDPTTGGADTDPSADSGSSSSGGSEQPLPPTSGAELLPWLEAGEYLSWTAESGVHPSSGPHGGGVRTFVNDVLHASLDAGATSHPEGAAAIKELYGDGDTVLGWAVEVKLQADSAGGAGWYWYELYGDSVYADGTGETLCTDCHVGGNDYVLSPFPLQ